MQAVISHDFGESSVEEIPRPDPGEGEVLVAVSRVQLSVTECMLYRGAFADDSGYGKVNERMREGDGRLFGHEFSGEVVEVGPGVEEFAVGDRVYAPNKVSCGECDYCEAGYRVYCENKGTPGMQLPGALAEYVALPEEPLCRLPDGVSDAEGAALQPLAAALMIVHDAAIETGDVVATVGAGVMGGQCGQLCLEAGAGRVLAVDVDPKKVELAESFGMAGVDATAVDPVEHVRAETDGIGADVGLEAVGGAQDHVTDGDDPMAQTYRLLRPGGTLVAVGQLTQEMSVNPGPMRKKYVNWVNPRDGAGVISTGPNADLGAVAADMVASGRVNIDDYITHEVDGLGGFEEAVEITMDKPAHGALGPAQMVVSG